MKIKITILVVIGILLTSCTPETATQESKVATEAPAVEVPVTQEPIATELPTEAPTNTPFACVALLTPINGANIPAVGKVTFSWTPIDKAGNYVLNVILPSGEIVPFETDQTFYDRYMEAFVVGGKYHWQVVAKNANGSEICISDVATFDKPTYEKPNGGGGGNSASGGGGDGGGCTDPFGCGGTP